MIQISFRGISRFAGLRRLAACFGFGMVLMPPGSVSGSSITWTDKATSGFEPAKIAVVDAAISTWEMLITDFGPLSGGRTTFSVSITEVSPLPGIGAAFGFTPDAAGVPLSGMIEIDDGTAAMPLGGFFVDPTPGRSTEYVPCVFDHYGPATTGGPAEGSIDLLTVVLHELGHVLGFEDTYMPWSLRIGPPTVLNYDITPPMMTAMLDDPDHLSHLVPAQPFDLMASAGALPTLGIGDRRLPSDLDLDILEGIYGYTVDRTHLETIAIPGDVNCDGTVDIFDVNLVSANWGTFGPTGDANGDGIVNIFDVNVISANWTAAAGGGVSAAIPEPATVWLAAVAGIFAAGAMAVRKRGS